MVKRKYLYLWFLLYKIVAFSTRAEGFEGFFQRATGFDGLSLEYLDVSKGRCTARCLSVTCRGIQFVDEGGHCKILYETSDVPQNERTKYNQVSITSDEENAVLINVHHKCSSNNPCHNDGLCESVENIYQCNCSDTDHYGSLCETVGNPWAAPDGWDTLHPQLNLNLDDQTPYLIHNGAVHVTTENGFGFKTNGGSQYVDLGSWLNQTCFVDIEQCEQGFTMFTYVDVYDASLANAGGNFQGYITGMVQHNKRYGPVFFGYNGLGFEVVQRNGDHFSAVMGSGVLNFPTGWIRVMLIYQVNTSIQLYVNNQLEKEATTFSSGIVPVGTDGRIVLGRHLVNTDQHVFRNGKLIVDWLTIWDRILTEEERNLLHQS